MRGRLFSATVYNQVGDNKRPSGCVGISFQPCPSLSAADLEIMIDELKQLHQKMFDNPNSPD